MQSNADSAAENPKDRQKYFVKPWEVNEPFSHFLYYLQDQSLQHAVDWNVKYSQTRIFTLKVTERSTDTGTPENDNLRGEYLKLYQDVEPDIRWASIALQRKPDAVNLWIGNSYSATALHRDNYENVYCQILGGKDFVLLPPLEIACVNEQFLFSATYSETMELIPDDPPVQVPCAIWDPDKSDQHTTVFSHRSRPIRVGLEPGDMLYLPACW